MPKQFLMTPGPSNVPPRVLEALGRPIVHHRSPDFTPIFDECIENLKYVFQTKNPVVPFAGSGSLAMEATVTSMLSPGDTMITLEAGKFGQRWGNIGRAFGMNVVALEAEWGTAISPETVEAALKANPATKAVFGTLCETSTAVRSDVEGLARVVTQTDAVLAIDAVSALAADRLETDKWDIDVVVSGSQKALMLPPGLAFVAVGPRARKLIDSATTPQFYTSLKKALKSLDDHTTPYTPAVSLMVGLNAALGMIREEGIENVWARHQKLSDGLRAGGEALDLKVFAQSASNTVVAYELPEGVAYKDLSLKMRDDYGLTIAGGQDHLKGKIFRMAAMGWADEKDVIAALGALEQALVELGHTVVQRGAGVAAALASFADA